jgi:ubiquinol-cytochrome c reductase cytochrome b subunit
MGLAVRRLLGVRETRGDRWASLFGQIAIQSLVVLVVTGVFLTLFFDPSMARVSYDGSYTRLHGVEMSRAYASALHLSFDVRGGLLMRQVHHWAALVFTASICCQLLRLMVTGAFRRPRVVRWLAWVTLLALAMAAGVTGGLLPDDMLSGGSLGLIQGVTESIPLAGTRIAALLFGGSFPGHVIIARAYWTHVVVLPVAIIGVFALLRRLARRHGEPRPAVPRLNAPMVSWVEVLLFTCGVLILLGVVGQINPVWMYGPYEPGATTAGAVPDWYMGFLDGAIRIMPGWEVDVAGHPLTLAVLVPALLVPGGFMTLLAAYPWLERRLTGDHGLHQVLDRPRDAATRTGVCAALVTFYVVLWAAAANDRIAVSFHLSLFAVTWIFRVAALAAPPLAFLAARALCRVLVELEGERARHGVETGRIVMSESGGFSEVHRAGELMRGSR